MNMCVYMGTLRVVTATDLVVVFTSPLKISEAAPPFTWSCEPREIHDLHC